MFADLIDEAEPTPRLVVLNSCASGASGDTELFAGTASALVRSGIRAVAAMQFMISDAAALEFSRGFYSALANGRGVDEAVRSGRIAILGLGRYTLEWVTPVLYLAGDEHASSTSPRRPFRRWGRLRPARRSTASRNRGPNPDHFRSQSRKLNLNLSPNRSAGAKPEPEPEPEPQRRPETDSRGARSRCPSEPDDDAPEEGPMPTRRTRSPTRNPDPQAEDPVRSRGIVIAAGSIALVGIVVAIVDRAVELSVDEQWSRGQDGPAEPSPPTTFTVPAAIPWTATGIECSAGDTLEITATGTVTDEADAATQVTPDGLPDTADREANLPALPDADALALIGRVGETQPFFVIGSDFTGICPSDGPLSVGLNDTAPSGNGGTFEVTATVTPSLRGNMVGRAGARGLDVVVVLPELRSG